MEDATDSKVMGPVAHGMLAITATFTDKVHPSFNCRTDFLASKYDIQLWVRPKILPKLKQGRAMIGGLGGEAKSVVRSISIKTIGQDDVVYII